MSAKLRSPITQINGYSVRPGMYNEMVLPSDEHLTQAVASLRWTTAKQDSWNAYRRLHLQDCPTCKGRGYTRKLPNVGCVTCKGVGYVDK